MLKSLKIENFRCFREFELQHLGRLNLLVGNNNSGKTSVLEAIQFLTSKTNLENQQEMMIGRGEYVLRGGDDHKELDIRHLYYGHNIDAGSSFSISALRASSDFTVSASIQRKNQLNRSESLEEYELLSVQVFATTHNSDCWTSLSEVVGADSSIQDGVTIHRIEKNSNKSVVFTERQMAIAAERGIEVR